MQGRGLMEWGEWRLSGNGGVVRMQGRGLMEWGEWRLSGEWRSGPDAGSGADGVGVNEGFQGMVE
jgi:hypothetical protein